MAPACRRGDRFFTSRPHAATNFVGARVMVSRVEVFEVADRLRALRGRDAVRVSVRRVREELLGKGSFSDVGPELAVWKSTRNYQPVIELMALPDALQTRLGNFGKALLDEVQAYESRVRDVERANFEVERTAIREGLDEAAMLVDVLEARVEALTAEVERLRKGGATEAIGRSAEDEAELLRRRKVWESGAALRASMLKKRDEKVVPAAQEAFWHSVETEVFALLNSRGPMPAGDLLYALPDSLLNRGADVEMPLSVGWLRYRLRTMIEAGKPIAEKNGRFMPAEESADEAPAAPPAVDEIRSPPPSLGDSVMWEVRRVLLERGPMKPAEIRKCLPTRVHEAAAKHWKGGLARLAKDMSERAGRGYYFKSLGDGRYAAIEGDAAGSSDSDRSA
ncbi:hypothetical protein FV241_11630 [Methylobacterium sp. WL2]|nr:hypothetical protein FVA80_13680 [Methylobacterium sp. WL1]TXN57306.1 hypothetical protein FV241_11630 [Methylobacterium sp. WL2]